MGNSYAQQERRLSVRWLGEVTFRVEISKLLAANPHTALRLIDE